MMFGREQDRLQRLPSANEGATVGVIPRLACFLRERLQTHTVRHGSRDFYTHLKGTHDLLKSWANPPEICHAGLFHSIYGTAVFTRRSVPVTHRHLVRELIGPKAEFLAYVFCACRRPATFLSLIRTGQHIVHDRYTNGLIVLSQEQFSQLLEIEAANLVEQKADAWDVLVALANADISYAAQREVRALAWPSDIERS